MPPNPRGGRRGKGAKPPTQKKSRPKTSKAPKAQPKAGALAAVYETGRTLAAGLVAQLAAHELLNPITALRFQVSFLDEELSLLARAHGDDLGAAQELCDKLRRELGRLEEGLKRLGHLAPFPGPRRAPLPLARPIQEALSLLAPEAEARGVDLTAELPPRDLRFFGDGAQLCLALFELAKAALVGFGELRQDGPVAISAAQESDRIRLEITAPPAGPDANPLGVALARRIVSEHGGLLFLGVPFILELPLGEESLEPQALGEA